MPLSTTRFDHADSAQGAAKRLPDIPLDRFRSPATSTCDTALRRSLPPDERWMVTAYGE